MVFDPNSLPDDPFASDDLPDDPFATTATATLPDNPFDAEELPDNPLDEPITPKPPRVPERGVIKKAGDFIGDFYHQMDNIYTPEGQASLLADPQTAGLTGALLSPIAALGGGDSPIDEAAKDSIHSSRMTGAPVNPQAETDLLIPKVIGGGVRMVASGGMAPIIEAGVKAADIAQNEPDAELSLANAGRVAGAGALTYLPMKGGQLAERAIANTGFGRLGGFLANAGIDMGLGMGAATAQKLVEQTATGQPIDLTPTKMDLATAIPSAIAAGVGGARSSGARQAEWDSTWGRNDIDPNSVHSTEQSLHNEVAREDIAATEAKAVETRDAVEAERIAVEDAQAQQAAREAAREALYSNQQRQQEAFAQKQGEVDATRKIEDIRKIGEGYSDGRYQKPLDPEVAALTGPIKERYADGRLRRPSSPLQDGYTSKEISPPQKPMTADEELAQFQADMDAAGVEAKASAQAIYDATLHAERKARGLIPDDTQQTLLLPAPEGRTPFQNDGAKMVQGEGDSDNYASHTPTEPQEIAPLSPLSRRGGNTDGQQQREVQGQTSGGLSPLRKPKSQPITATQEGVINSRGDEVPLPGKAVPTQSRANPLGLDLSKPNPAMRDSIAERGAQGRDPETGEQPKRVGGINLKRFAGNDAEMQDLIAGAQLTNAEAVDAQRFVKEGVLKRAASIDKWKDISKVEKIQPNQNLSDDEAISLDNYAMGAVSKFKENPTPENLEKMDKYLRASAGVGSAAGRALGARNIARKIAFSELPPWERGVINTREMFSAAGVEEMPRTAIDRFQKIKDYDDPLQVAEAIKDVVTKHKGLRGQIGAYRYMNMLSSPMTHALNAVSNAAMLGSEGIIRPVMRGMDKIAPGSSVMAKGETRAGFAGALAGMGDASTRAWYVMKHGFGEDVVKSLDPSKIRVEMRGGNKNPANYVNRALFGADEFFSSLGDAMTRSSLAHRKAYTDGIDKGLSGDKLTKHIEDTRSDFMWGDEEIDKAAKGMAKWYTHQEQSPYMSGKVAEWVPEPFKAGLEEAINHIIPFVKVPVNVLKKGAVVQGFGVLSPLSKASRESKLRNTAMGTAGLAATAALLPYAINDNITGDVPSDKAEREKFYETGKQPYSVNIGGRWIDYRMLGPFAQPLLSLAEYSSAIKNKKLNPDSSVATETAMGIAKSFTSLPVLSGVGGFIDALNDPERFGKSFLSNIASQYIPASSAQRFANKTGIAGDEVPETNTLREKIQGGTVADALLPSKLNSFGKPIKREGLFPKVNDSDPVYSELSRLDLNPPGTPTRATIKGVSQSLTPEQKRSVIESGSPAYDKVKEFINSPRYKAMPDDKKKIALQEVVKQKVQSFRGIGLRRLQVAEREKAN